jgi:hypothetical protein
MPTHVIYILGITVRKIVVFLKIVYILGQVLSELLKAYII